MTERHEHIKGMTDPKLEIVRKRNWRDKVTPTKPEDIGPRARAYMRLRDGLVLGLLELEGCGDDRTSPFYHRAKDQIDMVKDEARALGFEYSTLELVAKNRIQEMKDEAIEDESEDVEGESERKTMMRNVPVTVKKDAGFPAPELRRRGW